MTPVPQHELLERLLGQVAQEPALDILEDRAHDAGHLEDDQYDRVLSASTESEDQELVNLKRHVLFCDVCGPEMLRRAAPALDVEDDDPAPDKSPRPNNGKWLPLILVGLLAAGVGYWLGRLGQSVPAPRETEAPVVAVVGRARVGRLMGRTDVPERLFLEVDTGASPRPVHLYLFVRAGDRLVPVHPSPDSGLNNPLPPGVMPASGFSIPAAGGSRSVLGVVDLDPVPGLQDMDAVAKSLRLILADGDGERGLIRVLEDLARGLGSSVFYRALEE